MEQNMSSFICIKQNVSLDRNDGIQRFKSLLNILRNYQEIVRQECRVHQWTNIRC